MLPSLFVIGSVRLSTFPLSVLCAAILAAFLFWRRTHRDHLDDDEVFDVLALSVVVSVLSSKIAYLLLHATTVLQYLENTVFFFLRQGSHEMTGVLVWIWSVGYFAKKRKWDHFEIMDSASLCSMWYVSVVWLGRFFAGAQLGTVTTLPWGVVFPNTYEARHPVQLYFSFTFFLCAVLLTVLEKRYRFFAWYRGNRQSVQSGFVVSVFCLLYGGVSFVFGLLKVSDVMLGGVNLDLLTAIGVMIWGGGLLYVRSGYWTGAKKRKIVLQQRNQVPLWQRIIKGRV